MTTAQHLAECVGESNATTMSLTHAGFFLMLITGLGKEASPSIDNKNCHSQGILYNAIL